MYLNGLYKTYLSKESLNTVALQLFFQLHIKGKNPNELKEKCFSCIVTFGASCLQKNRSDFGQIWTADLDVYDLTALAASGIEQAGQRFDGQTQDNKLEVARSACHTLWRQ